MSNFTNDTTNSQSGDEQDMSELELKLNNIRNEFVIEDVMIEDSLNDLKEILPSAELEDLGLAGIEFQKMRKRYAFLKNNYIKHKIEKKYGSKLTQEEIDEFVRDENIREFSELEEAIIKKRIKNKGGIVERFIGKKAMNVLNIWFNNNFNKELNLDKKNITIQEKKRISLYGDDKKLNSKQISEKNNIDDNIEDVKKLNVQEDIKIENVFVEENVKNKSLINENDSILNSQYLSNKNKNEKAIEKKQVIDDNDLKKDELMEDKIEKKIKKENLNFADKEMMNEFGDVNKKSTLEKKETYIDFEEILSETEAQAIRDVNLQRKKFINNTEKYSEDKEQKNLNDPKKKYSREEAIVNGLSILFSYNLSKKLIKDEKNASKEGRQFELIKNDIIDFCNKINREEIFRDMTGEVSAEIVFKYNKKLFNLFRQNKLHFPIPKFCNFNNGTRLKKDNFNYFTNEYMKNRNIFLGNIIVDAKVKGENFKKFLFEFYEIAGQKEELLIDDKIRKLRLLDDMDRGELNEMSNRYVDIIILSNSLLEQNDYSEPGYSGRINYGNIVVYGGGLDKEIGSRFKYLNTKEYVRQIVIPREKAYIIGGELGMNEIFKEGMSDGFFLEYAEDENFQDLVDERISASMHNPMHIISFFCLKGALEKLEKKEKTDPIQVFNLLNYKKTNSTITIDKFKKRYWEIFNNLCNSNNKDDLLEEIRNLGIRGVDDDLEKIGFNLCV